MLSNLAAFHPAQLLPYCAAMKGAGGALIGGLRFPHMV